MWGDMTIMTVTLDRLAAGFADGVLQRFYSLLLRRGCASHVENLFLQDCPMQIVYAIAERDLCEGQPKAHPIRGQMVDVIQVNSAHREIAKLFQCRGAFYVG